MPNVRDVEQIRAIIETRVIDRLCHFTQLSNLESILENGLLTRAQIEEQGLNANINDHHRQDGNLNATCCSISVPNYRMFYKKKRLDESVKWVLIRLSPDILLEKDCAFYRMNAASGEVMDIDVNDFKNVAAFSSMFAEVEGKPSRATMRQPDNYTTDPEAEVLVFDQIERRHILMILTDCQTTANEWNAKRLGIDFHVLANICPPRNDWIHWQK